MSIEFVVPGVPVAQPRQRHRVIKCGEKLYTGNYTPTKDPVNAFKATVRLVCAETYDGPPMTGPLEARLLFFFPRPKGKIWKTKLMLQYWKQSKPDCDNLGKSVLDALSGLLFIDDAQIVSLSIKKFVAAGDDQPRVVMSFTSLNGTIWAE